MPTSQLNFFPKTTPAGITLNPQACAQVQAERERLGITEAELERTRAESLMRPF
jgi:hypothetical protein